MDRCELIPLQEDEDFEYFDDFEFYCETCGEYVNGPCNDDNE